MKKIILIFILIININYIYARPIASHGLFVDETKTISFPFKYKINSVLKNYSRPIAIYIINSLKAEDIKKFSSRVKKKWNLNSSNDEILLIISLGDRMIHFSTADSIKGIISENQFNQIISILGSFLKNSHFETGIVITLNILGNYLNEPFKDISLVNKSRSFKQYDFLIPIILIIFFFLFLGRNSLFSKDKAKYEPDNKNDLEFDDNTNKKVTSKKGSGSF